MGHDLVVLGAGIAGVVAAYQAARRHADWRILLIDRDRVASGATGYSAGLATTWGQTAEKRALASRAAVMFDQMAEEVPGTALEPQSIVWLVAHGSANRFTANWAGHPPAVVIGEARQQLVDRLPRDLRIPPGFGLYCDQTARVGDPPAICRAVVDWLRSRPGFELWEGIALTSALPAAGDVLLTTDDGREFTSARFLAFPGPWAREDIWAPSLLGAETRIKKVVALHIERTPEPAVPALYFFDDEAFLLPKTREGRSLLSITSRSWDREPARGGLHVERDDVLTADAILQKYFAGGLPIGGGRVFCDAYTRDFTPAIRRLAGLKRGAIAYGGSGSGFRLAPAIAESALRLVDDCNAGGVGSHTTNPSRPTNSE
jgi:glycine/D-amino acid oxidase-like deaminating enzyme